MGNITTIEKLSNEELLQEIRITDNILDDFFLAVEHLMAYPDKTDSLKLQVLRSAIAGSVLEREINSMSHNF